MFSSLFLQYKNVVHVIPTKCLQADNLFDIIICIHILFKPCFFYGSERRGGDSMPLQ